MNKDKETPLYKGNIIPLETQDPNLYQAREILFRSENVLSLYASYISY